MNESEGKRNPERERERRQTDEIHTERERETDRQTERQREPKDWECEAWASAGLSRLTDGLRWRQKSVSPCREKVRGAQRQDQIR
jgi:hypothetical protein